jgi:hypothetical protein
MSGLFFVKVFTCSYGICIPTASIKKTQIMKTDALNLILANRRPPPDVLSIDLPSAIFN